MDYPAYPVYRKSGIDWLGDIPNHWVFYRLRFTAKINPLKSEVSDLLPDKLVSFVPMEAIGEYGGIELSRVKPIESVYNGYSFFKDNDLLIAKITPCFENGKGAIATSLQNGIGFGTTELHVIRADQDFSKEFLFYLSISHSFRNIGESTMFGAGGQKRISEDFIKDFRVFFPSYAEQQTIAQFLDHKTQQIDQLIAKKQTLIDKLNEQRIALITHAVTKGLNPAVTLKGSGVEWLGEVPEHWGVCRLRFLGECQNGINIGGEYFGKGHPFVSYGDVYNNRVLPREVNGLVESTDVDRKVFSVKSADVFFTRTSETIEEIAMPSVCMADIENAVFAGFLIRFRPNNNGLVKEFSKFYFQNASLRAFFVKEMNLVTRASLSQDLLRNLPVLLPSPSEQTAIADYLEAETQKIDDLIDLNQQTMDKLKEYRTALITAAVTGKIDVRNWRQTETKGV